MRASRLTADVAGYSLLREITDVEGNTAVTERDKQEQERDKRKLVCSTCSHVVTAADKRIQVNNSHKHTFFNPAGIVYELGCFSDAPGCMAIGERSREFSWFAGASWQVVLCGNCQSHLGWLFRTADSTFYGLILAQLLEENRNHQ